MLKVSRDTIPGGGRNQIRPRPFSRGHDEAFRQDSIMTDRGQVRIGISGWTYAPWRGLFYPEGLPHRQELSFASGQFNSIEVNGTFY
jgi:hypothetical protein